jgi:Abortive infection bacteriophage resistance protein
MKQKSRSLLEQKLKKLQYQNFVIDEIDINIDLVKEMSFYRVAKIAKKIHLCEPLRIFSLTDITKIFYIEQDIRQDLTNIISYWEIHLRSILSEYYEVWYGPHGYKEKTHFFDPPIHKILLAKIAKQLDMKSQYEVIEERNIHNLADLPIWYALEVSTMHMLTLFYQILTVDKQEAIAEHFGVSSMIFSSWLSFILVVRNACAHQGLLFNRTFDRPVILPATKVANVGGAYYILNTLLAKTEFMLKFRRDKSSENCLGYEWVKKYYGL